MSSATKGAEREDFINKFLADTLPPTFRFGDGDITDRNGLKSGQVEIVVEYPFLPSLPMMGTKSRLYLAEGVGAVVEVKSNLKSQWDEAIKTAAAVKKLQRIIQPIISIGDGPSQKVPFFVVGYKGWTDPETVKKKLAECGDIDGILIIDPGIFISNNSFGAITAGGPWSLWGLIHCLHKSVSSLQAVYTSPLDYAL